MNTAIEGCLPTTLTHVYFGEYFNQKIDDLPKSVKFVALGIYFSGPIDGLPNLTHLMLTSRFIDVTATTLPQTLTHLKFSEIFNQPIAHYPPNLMALTFGIDQPNCKQSTSNTQQIAVWV